MVQNRNAVKRNHRKVGVLAALFVSGMMLLAKPALGNLVNHGMARGSVQSSELDDGWQVDNSALVQTPVNERLESFKRYVKNIPANDKEALVNALYFEMGRSPSDWAGVLSVISNRAYIRNTDYSNDNMPYLNVLSPKKQFTGYQPKKQVPSQYYDEVERRVDFHLRDITDGIFVPTETTNVMYYHSNLVQKNGKYVIDTKYDHNIYCEDFYTDAAAKVKNYREISSPYQTDLNDRYRQQKILVDNGKTIL